jgi:uncharacterized protein YndB with AHSA1/START domain
MADAQVLQNIGIATTPELAFEALTKASELREWCCDRAWTEIRLGGRYELHWNSGYWTDGKFIELEPPQRAAVTWQGTGEPGETIVAFTVELHASGVRVTVTHRGFGAGDVWDRALAESEAGWSKGLENLKSTLETGIDLRLARQPFLGIHLDLLTPQRAAEEGIAAENGIYVLDTVAGSGAQEAGLAKGDVIVRLGNSATPGFQELGQALRTHQPGDLVEVEWVRGQDRTVLPIRLGTRPVADLPETAHELAERLAAHYEEVNEELRAALSGLGEEQAEQAPAPESWSVKQVLAHLSDSERTSHVFGVNVAVNGWLDGEPLYPDQIPGRLEAVLAVTPTLAGLLERLSADQAETVALVRHLPADTLAHKARFRRLAQQVLAALDHTREHVEQIRQALQALRGA